MGLSNPITYVHCYLANVPYPVKSNNLRALLPCPLPCAEVEIWISFLWKTGAVALGSLSLGIVVVSNSTCYLWVKHCLSLVASCCTLWLCGVGVGVKQKKVMYENSTIWSTRSCVFFCRMASYFLIADWNSRLCFSASTSELLGKNSVIAVCIELPALLYVF